MNYKIIKYKIKFLNSIKNSNFDKSKLYLKKYSNYYNQYNFNQTQIQIGGSIVEINNNKDLDKLMTNISSLMVSIFGKDLGDLIINEFKIKTNFNEITFPTEINLDIIIKNILKSIYSNLKTGKYSNDEFEKQINIIINNTFKENVPKKEPEIKLKEEKMDLKDLLNLIKTKEKPEQSDGIENIFSTYTPYPTKIYSPNPIIYSQPIVNWNYDDLGLNIKISDSLTESSDSSLGFNKKKNKKYKKNKFGKNIIIY